MEMAKRGVLEVTTARERKRKNKGTSVDGYVYSGGACVLPIDYFHPT